ncbi:helix-turn-helix domain-containing protein [Mangrovicella endophytica]|uniref:helix-turn-helix domain-containing protein n=1 Tax=Mangrovicella endophytica TaxID=2066697 RepID=UPI000C9E4A51|nr:helix-turn-helix transcriptional regulator [Mangrovicella endophytica]
MFDDNQVDRHVGQRLRALRISRGISQTALGEAIGVTFQQVQKYESGSNRISASKLHRVCTHFKVPVSYFFDEIPPSEEEAALADLPTLAGREIESLQLILQLDPQVKRAIYSLAKSLRETTPN